VISSRGSPSVALTIVPADTISEAVAISPARYRFGPSRGTSASRRWLIICSTVKRFLGISAPFKMDPEAKYLTQQMDKVNGGQVRNGRIGQNEVLGTENHSMYIGNRNGTVSGPVIAGLEIPYFSVRFARNTYDDQDVMTSGFGFDDAVFQETVMRFQPVGSGSQTQIELDFSTRVFKFQATGIPISVTLLLLSFSLAFFGLAARRRVGCQSSAG